MSQVVYQRFQQLLYNGVNEILQITTQQFNELLQIAKDHNGEANINSFIELLQITRTVAIGYEIKNLTKILEEIRNSAGNSAGNTIDNCCDVITSRSSEISAGNFAKQPRITLDAASKETIKNMLINLQNHKINIAKLTTAANIERKRINRIKSYLLVTNVIGTINNDTATDFVTTVLTNIIDRCKQAITQYNNQIEIIDFDMETVRSKLTTILFNNFHIYGEAAIQTLIHEIEAEFYDIFYVSLRNELTNKLLEYSVRSSQLSVLTAVINTKQQQTAAFGMEELFTLTPHNVKQLQHKHIEILLPKLLDNSVNAYNKLTYFKALPQTTYNIMQEKYVNTLQHTV